MMKIFSGILLLTLILLGVSCDPRRDVVFESLVELERGDGTAADAQKIDDLKREIAEADDTVQKLLTQAQKTGTFWRQLGLEYFNLKMYTLAYQAFEKALNIYPQSASVHYYMGLTSGQLALAQGDRSQNRRWIDLAVGHQEKAVAFRPDFTEALYALAILYSYETEQPEKAGILVKTILSQSPNDEKAQMLQARISYQLGDLNGALTQYEALGKNASDPGLRQSAQKNALQIRGGQ